MEFDGIFKLFLQNSVYAVKQCLDYTDHTCKSSISFTCDPSGLLLFNGVCYIDLLVVASVSFINYITYIYVINIWDTMTHIC
jgi:hypothetical protein